MGYYNDPDKTAAAFVQNPLQSHYPERVYKTGDLVRWNERGELIYLSRRDFQIKHMGYRIELGEIEAAATAQPGVDVSVCLYDQAADQLILIYVGAKAEQETVRQALQGSAARLYAAGQGHSGQDHSLQPKRQDRPKGAGCRIL